MDPTRRTLLKAAVASAIVAACTRHEEHAAPASALAGIVPAPLQLIPGAGVFLVRPGATIGYIGDALVPVIERFRADVARRTGLTLAPARAAAAQSSSLRIELAAAIDNDFDALPEPIGLSPAGDPVPDERYALTIGSEGIFLRGVQAIGAARGLTTLLQLFATTATDAEGAIALPVASILDVPRFAWRGLTFDLSGTLFKTPDLRRVIDLAALYKLNVLNLRLTSDQNMEAGQRPDGYDFYTDSEVSALARYAAERFITLVSGTGTPVAALTAADDGLSHVTPEEEEEGEGTLPSVLPAAAADTPVSSAADAEVLAPSAAILVSPRSHACFDVPYAEHSATAAQEVRRRRLGQQLYPPKTVAEFFDWDPAAALPLGAAPGTLGGVGAVISTDTVRDFDDLTFLLLPRMAGFAHRAWSEPRRNVWSAHRQALALQRRLWEQDGLTYFQTSTVEW